MEALENTRSILR